MGMTIAEKILAKKSGQAKVVPGDVVTVEVDTVVLFDNNFMPSIWREIRKLHDSSRIVVVLDHRALNLEPVRVEVRPARPVAGQESQPDPRDQLEGKNEQDRQEQPEQGLADEGSHRGEGGIVARSSICCYTGPTVPDRERKTGVK